jgi:hypothetical protein
MWAYVRVDGGVPRPLSSHLWQEAMAAGRVLARWFDWVVFVAKTGAFLS